MATPPSMINAMSKRSASPLGWKSPKPMVARVVRMKYESASVAYPAE